MQDSAAVVRLSDHRSAERRRQRRREKQRRWRARQRDGIRVYPLAIDAKTLCDLENGGLLDLSEVDDHEIRFGLEALIEELAKAVRKKL